LSSVLHTLNLLLIRDLSKTGAEVKEPPGKYAIQGVNVPKAKPPWSSLYRDWLLFAGQQRPAAGWSGCREEHHLLRKMANVALNKPR
jgi:hypothetical protein